MSTSIHRPRHTAEEVAEKLREEVTHHKELVVACDARARHISDGFELPLQAARGNERSRISAAWSWAHGENAKEHSCLEARLGEHRRLLQWLTGELWS